MNFDWYAPRLSINRVDYDRDAQKDWHLVVFDFWLLTNNLAIEFLLWCSAHTTSPWSWEQSHEGITDGWDVIFRFSSETDATLFKLINAVDK